MCNAPGQYNNDKNYKHAAMQKNRNTCCQDQNCTETQKFPWRKNVYILKQEIGGTQYKRSERNPCQCRILSPIHGVGGHVPAKGGQEKSEHSGGVGFSPVPDDKERREWHDGQDH